MKFLMDGLWKQVACNRGLLEKRIISKRVGENIRGQGFQCFSLEILLTFQYFT